MEEEYEAMLATQYNKLQEQNQESKYIRDMQIEELTKQLAEQLKRNKELESALNNSVSKDEINAKIEELNTITNSGGYPFIKKRNSSIQIEVLQELLNKGE